MTHLKNLIFLVIAIYGYSSFATTSLDCLNRIKANQEFHNSPHHPENYYFSASTPFTNRFLLIQAEKSFICRANENLQSGSTIDILSDVPRLKLPRRLIFEKLVASKKKPQTKNPTVPLVNGFLPLHVSFNSAQEISYSARGQKLTAICEVATGTQELNEALDTLALQELGDFYASFADQRDSLAYNYDVNESFKIKDRFQFDTKLKDIIEFCSLVPSLKSTTVDLIEKLKKYSKVAFKIPSPQAVPASTNVKLPSRVNQ